MLEGLASTGQTEISEFVQTCLYHIRKVNSQNQQGELNYFYNQYGFPLIHYISVLKNENDHVICIKIPIARNDGQVLHYFQAIRYGDEFGYFLIGTESNIADEIDENQDFPEVLSIETEEDDDFDGSGGGSSSNFESSGCIKIVPLTTPICREEPCPNNCTPCRHPRINCAKRDDDGNSGGGGTGGGGSSSGTIVITIWSDRGTFNWGGKGGPPPNNPSYGGGNTNGSADTKCIFKREEIEEAFVSYFNTNYPDLQIPNNHVPWYVDEGCLRQVCEDYFDTGIKDFNNCFEDAIRKMYRLTEEEWEDYKADKSCKRSIENISEVNKFRTDVSKAIEDELRQMAIDFPGVPFDADLFKTILSKVILKKTGKLIPLVGIGLDLAELKSAYVAGNYLAMGLSIGSILTEIIPCAMLTDLLVDAASIGNTLFMTYKSLSELKTFLGTNSTLFRAIFETIDELNLIDAVEILKKWTKKSAD